MQIGKLNTRAGKLNEGIPNAENIVTFGMRASPSITKMFHSMHVQCSVVIGVVGLLFVFVGCEAY